MNNAPADPTAQSSGEIWLAEPGPSVGGWPQSKLIFFIILALAAHVGFLFLFGTKKAAGPRAVTNVPQLQLADAASELIALDDPTLFALPHANDFATAFWQRPPDVKPQNFRWTEDPRYLTLAHQNLGAAFAAFTQTNPPVRFALDFKPPPFAELLTPGISLLAQNSTLQITGDLAQRRLLNQINLPALPCNDVLPPGRVQALVDAAGNVVSVVLLEPSGLELADTNAIAIARTARFAPAAQFTLGEMIFDWHTIPAIATNSTTVP